jgi:hypothetical protein
LKDSGQTSKLLQGHLENSKANWVYGALLLPESTGIITSCQTKDSMAKHMPKLLVRNYHTAMTN